MAAGAPILPCAKHGDAETSANRAANIIADFIAASMKCLSSQTHCVRREISIGWVGV